MDRWAWEHGYSCARHSRSARCSACCAARLPVTRGRRWVRSQLHQAARRSGVRATPFAPPQLRHAHAVEMSREGVPLLVIQRQLGHADLAITSVYLRGIDNTEIVHAVHERPAPMIQATHGL
jgi:site-specific recombinase XerD